MRVVTFAFLLLAAAGLVVTGVALWSVPAAFITGGVLFAVWSVLLFAEVSG